MQGNVRMADDGTPICQHGAAECELNMLLQCALAELAPDSSPPGEAPIAQRMLECFFDALLKHHGRADILRQTAQTCIAAAGNCSPALQHPLHQTGDVQSLLAPSEVVP